MKTLIVIDMQNDFIDGPLGTKEAVAIVGNVAQKIMQYRANGDAVVFTRDTHQTDYLNTPEGRKLPVEHCIEGTDGWQISDALEVGDSLIVDKPTFGWKGWLETKEKFDLDFTEIELIGLCTDICVVSNAIILKSLFPEAVISVDASCCAGVTPETHNAALVTMKMCQIDVFGELKSDV